MIEVSRSPSSHKYLYITRAVNRFVEMKGYVPTPGPLADRMVEKLFRGREPREGDRILYPGCGEGPFIGAVRRYCEGRGLPVPQGLGVEMSSERLEEARERHGGTNVEFVEGDFLSERSDLGEFDFVVGNPPYVPIEGLSGEEKERYRGLFETAVGRFDLYVLFFERSLDLLRLGGRLCFVTPEKFEYTETTAPLRRLLAGNRVEEIDHVPEDSFGGLVTYPTVTVVENGEPGTTRVVSREGEVREVELPREGESWAAVVRGGSPDIETGVTLEEVCQRISCGVATGADGVFVMDREDVPPQLVDWTYPTTSGRQLGLNDGPESGQVFLSPYDGDGNLVPEERLGAFGDWASLHRGRLEDRSCLVKGRRPWYGWHENPPMGDILQPKLLCKDVAEEPHFWRDGDGEVVPRHSVYYVVPGEGTDLEALQEYLNSDRAKRWIEANCQRAANGYLRLQSRVLKKLPVPLELAEHRQAKLSGIEAVGAR